MSSQLPSKILVLGAGELGHEVLLSLAKRKPSTTSISVLLRPKTISNPSAAKAEVISTFAMHSISVVQGDIAKSTIEDLAQIFKSYDLIISCLGFASGPGSQVKICTAVLSAGVKHYFPWQFGVDYDIIGRGSAQPLFDEQLDVRDVLRSQTETLWTIISTGMFTSFLFEASFGIVNLKDEKGGAVVRGLGGWENRVTVTSPRDIGRLTAEIVFAEPRVSGVVYTAGETISYGDLADVVESVLGKKVRREEWNVEEVRSRLEEDPEDVVKKYRVVFAEGEGVSWDMEQTFNWKRSISTEDVRGWMERTAL